MNQDRTTRVFYVGVVSRPVEEPPTVHANALSVAAAERVQALTREFSQLPRSGDTVYGFAAGLYPTDHPTLPEADDESA
jgi:hypothetical protein